MPPHPLSSRPASIPTTDAWRTADNGGVARTEMIEHRARFDRQLHQVADGVWCVVGNGLSNQTFVEGPDGSDRDRHRRLDRGDGVGARRRYASTPTLPVVGVIYSHFHYVGGTQALVDAGAPATFRSGRTPG